MKLPPRLLRPYLDIYFMVFASLMFALSGVFAKLLANELSSIEIMFFRNIVGTAFILYQITKIKHKKVGGHFWFLLIRSVAAVISLYLFFYNVSSISLGGAYAFLKTNAIFIIVIALIFLHEKLNFFAICGILISFVGVLFIVDPFSFSGFSLQNSFFGILSGLFSAISLTSMRQLGHYYNTEYIVLGLFGVGVIAPVISMVVGEFFPSLNKFDFAVSRFVVPSGIAFLWIVLMGWFSLLYQVYYTKAYRITKKAGIVAGVSYIDIPFTLLFGLMLGDSFPSFIVFCGIVMVVCGGVIVSTTKNR